MLKYKLNINRLANEMVPINVINIESYNEDDYPNGIIGVKCSYDSNVPIEIYDRLTVRYNDIILNSNGEKEKVNTYNEYTIKDVDKENSIFYITDNKRVVIECESATIRTMTANESDDENSGKIDYMYFYFNQTHHFPITEDETMAIYVNDVKIECQVVDGFTLRAVINDNKEGYDYVFESEYSRMTKYVLMKSYRVTRDQFFFNEYGINIVKFYLNKQISCIRLPLSSTFGTDIHNEISIRSKFVDVERDKVIPAFTDNEKDIYYPAICTSKKNGIIDDEGDDAVFESVDKIVLNFHFRNHTGDTWTVDKRSIWNGVVEDNNTLKYGFMNGSASSSDGFFSYPFSKRDYQSDLLYYLGFSDADLKYQHKRLTKSFVRLLFYDSTDSTKQNLLSYAVVYLNVNELFSKYMRNVHNEDLTYSMLEGNAFNKRSESENTTLKLKGIRVNREPYWENVQERPQDIDEIEKYRLSSQIVLKDKYNSSSSSEGFYLYLWKENYGGIEPKDIYMKVEFNHAGYGRIIPFMMPYKNGGEVKSFNEIVTNDWEPSNDVDIPYNKGYDYIEYSRYSYIHFKYRYDRQTNRHVYYLDPSYKVNDKNSIILNLYEANVK